jgi:hypothetical protein
MFIHAFQSKKVISSYFIAFFIEKKLVGMLAFLLIFSALIVEFSVVTNEVLGDLICDLDTYESSIFCYKFKTWSELNSLIKDNSYYCQLRELQTKEAPGSDERIEYWKN